MLLSSDSTANSTTGSPSCTRHQDSRGRSSPAPYGKTRKGRFADGRQIRTSLLLTPVDTIFFDQSRLR